MTKTPDKTPPAGMRAGIRRPRGPGGSWSYVLDMGLVDAQRCANPECPAWRPSKTVPGSGAGLRLWVGGERLDACPRCGGSLRDTRERRQSVQGGYPTQAVAKEERAKALVKLGQGSYVAPQRKTLAQFLRDEWVPQIEDECEQGDLKATSLDTYKRNVREHLIGPVGSPFPLGQAQLRELSLDMIRSHYRVLAAGYPVERDGKTTQHPGLCPQSVRRVHAALHRSLNDAIERQYIDTNPAWRALRKQPKPLRFEGSVWSGEELQAFLTATVGTPLHPLWFTAATTGLRRGELCGLKWSDLDLVGGALTAARSRVPLGGKIVESTPKSGEARTFAIDGDTVAILEHHRKAQTAARLKAGPKWQDSGYVFTKKYGEPINPNYVSRAFRLAIDAAELRTIRLHDMRHTHASLLLAAGEPIGNVSYRLGHSSSVITSQVYEHYIPGAQKATAARFQSIMRDAREKAV